MYSNPHVNAWRIHRSARVQSNVIATGNGRLSRALGELAARTEEPFTRDRHPRLAEERLARADSAGEKRRAGSNRYSRWLAKPARACTQRGPIEALACGSGGTLSRESLAIDAVLATQTTIYLPEDSTSSDSPLRKSPRSPAARLAARASSWSEKEGGTGEGGRRTDGEEETEKLRLDLRQGVEGVNKRLRCHLKHAARRLRLHGLRPSSIGFRPAWRASIFLLEEDKRTTWRWPLASCFPLRYACARAASAPFLAEQGVLFSLPGAYFSAKKARCLTRIIG